MKVLLLFCLDALIIYFSVKFGDEKLDKFFERHCQKQYYIYKNIFLVLMYISIAIKSVLVLRKIFAFWVYK